MLAFASGHANRKKYSDGEDKDYNPLKRLIKWIWKENTLENSINRGINIISLFLNCPPLN